MLRDLSDRISNQHVPHEASGDQSKVVKMGPDMDSLRKEFASKLPPESTIKRIEALEKFVENMKDRKPESIVVSGNGVDDSLYKRVDSLEEESAEGKTRLTTCEHEIALLKR